MTSPLLTQPLRLFEDQFIRQGVLFWRDPTGILQTQAFSAGTWRPLTAEEKENLENYRAKKLPSSIHPVKVLPLGETS